MKKLILTTLAISSLLLSKAQNLVISEIHYNPADEGAILGDNLEFIEISNTGSSTINLTGYSFTGGVTYVFGSGAKINVGESIVLAKNKAVFDAFTGKTAFGQYTGGLKNTGETITLSDLVLNPVFKVTYSDLSPWPALADGAGYSLELINPTLPNEPSSWISSSARGGSPGTYNKDQNAVTFPVIVNEILSNTWTGEEKIELYNTGDVAVEISNWYITDDKKIPEKYQIAPGTTIAPRAYKVFTSADFGLKFSLSKKGEEAYIFSADVTGKLTGYSNGFPYSVTDVDQSYGLHVTSEYKTTKFVQKTQTFGTKNDVPVVGPLVITDVMYNPDLLTDEFVVMKNISNQSISSNSPFLPDSNGIRITAINYKFDFKNPTTFKPYEAIFFTSISPSIFRNKYSLTPDVQVFQYTGSLGNSNDLIEIQIPVYRDTLLDGSYDNHFKTMDEVHYYDSAPWPTSADAGGAFLHRKNYLIYGNDPIVWGESLSPLLTLVATEETSEELSTIIYPTIADDKLFITNALNQKYQILSIQGLEIAKGKISGNEIDLSIIESGSYLIQILGEGSSKTFKFVKN
jgi:hypothetical protein